MIDISMDMEQYDCPFIDTTADNSVSFSAYQWDFDRKQRALETRLIVGADDRGELDAGLRDLRDHPNMNDYVLIARQDDVAHIRTVIEETDAMRTIRSNDGYITGPFRIADGSEVWEVGFDDQRAADIALSELDRNNEFTVETETSLELDDLFDLLENAEAAGELLEGCRELSAVERETLSVAAQEGYFEQPRDATLQTLSEEFDVSDTAISKNLRRGERKVLRRVVSALDSIDDA
jgi:predicted DNA binding protein